MATPRKTSPATGDAVKTAKALSYIGEGRVRVLHVDRSHVDALVRGSDPSPYVVARFGDEPFTCTCQAGRTGRVICSHVIAVALVVGPGHAPEARARDPWAAYVPGSGRPQQTTAAAAGSPAAMRVGDLGPPPRRVACPRCGYDPMQWSVTRDVGGGGTRTDTCPQCGHVVTTRLEPGAEPPVPAATPSVWDRLPTPPDDTPF